MGDSFAGITVPEGEPAALRDAGGRMGRAGATLSAVGDGLGSLPASLTAWQGGGSLSYGNACVTSQGAVAGGASACAEGERLLTAYADDLEDAQEKARTAIRDAKDATERKQEAQGRLEAAQNARAVAAAEELMARTEYAATSLFGMPSPGAEADIRAAEQAGAAAADDEAAARRDLERAEQDLEDAKQRGEAAEKSADEAAGATAAALSGVADGRVQIPIIGAPAEPVVTAADVPEEDDGGGFMGWVHGGLDLAGFLPVAGAIPDALNAGIYVIEGDGKNALWSIGAAVPFAGDGAKAVKIGKETAEAIAKRGGREALEEAAENAAKRHADELAALTRVTGDVAQDAAAWRSRASTGTSRLTDALGGAKPDGHAAHHIIPRGAYSARKPEAREALEESQAILQKYNIGPDDAGNGVFLKQDVHAKLHTDQYFTALRDRLQEAGSASDARAILDDVADELATNGKLQ
jgi:A nuclease family of the HNH/ENDO VII superfamily with conserved AHH